MAFSSHEPYQYAFSDAAYMKRNVYTYRIGMIFLFHVLMKYGHSVSFYVKIFCHKMGTDAIEWACSPHEHPSNGF